MPFVHISAVQEVLGDTAAEKKQGIAQRVADAINEYTGIPQSDIWIVFEDVPAREWYVGSRDQETALREKGRI